MPGQTLTYAIDVLNYDVGCGSSTFAVSVAAPGGFSVSMPTNSITLKSSGTRLRQGERDFAWRDRRRRLPTDRHGTASRLVDFASSFDSYYRVYSSDSLAPNLYWASPGDGTTISGNSYNVSVSSDDDHAVQKIELYIDNVYKSTTVCGGVSYRCQL